MRVISQDGTLDAPYERLIITLSGNVSKAEYCIDGHLSDQKNSLFVKLAVYSAKEKARKAMEMLRAEFCDYGESGVFRFPTEEELE